MNGPQAMLGWLLGAIVAVCDGLVWAELGAAMPGTGGPYRYLSEAFGPKRLGTAHEFFVHLGDGHARAVVDRSWRGGVRAVHQISVAADEQLARKSSGGSGVRADYVHAVPRYSVGRQAFHRALGGGDLYCVSGDGHWVTHFQLSRVLDFPPHAFTLSREFFVGLGGATLLAMYDYGGYNNSCFFAGEIKRPEYVIPRSILISIFLVGILYLTMNVSILGVVPWREAMHSTFIVSDLMQRVYGLTVAKIMTGSVLLTTFASLFAVLLGYSRVPYAAAVDGRFFSVFGKLHPTRNFPWVSLLFMGRFGVGQLAGSVGSDYCVGCHSSAGSIYGAGRGRNDDSPVSAGYSAAVSDVVLPCHERDCFWGMGFYPGGQRTEIYFLGNGVDRGGCFGFSVAGTRAVGVAFLASRGSRRMSTDRPLDVLVVGDLFAELVMSGFASWPPASGQEIYAERFFREVGGGGRPSLHRVWRNWESKPESWVRWARADRQWLLYRLRANRVDISAIRHTSRRTDGHHLSVSSPHRSYLFDLYGRQSRTAARCSTAASQNNFSKAKHVHLACAPEPDRAWKASFARCRKEMLVSLDVGWHPEWLADRCCHQALRQVDIFFPNENEASRMTGETDPAKILEAFEKMAFHKVALKLGSSGAVLLYDGGDFLSAARRRRSVGPTGAGDCFDAGFLVCLASRRNPQSLLKSRAICGAFSTRRMGGIAGFPTSTELEGQR